MTSVLQEVLEVNKMSIEALRKKYKELFNAEAPLTASRRQLDSQDNLSASGSGFRRD